MNDFFSLVNVKESINIVALFTFTKKVLNGKLYFFVHNVLLFAANAHPAITCSKLTIETPEKGVKHVPS